SSSRRLTLGIGPRSNQDGFRCAPTERDDGGQARAQPRWTGASSSGAAGIHQSAPRAVVMYSGQRESRGGAKVRGRSGARKGAAPTMWGGVRRAGSGAAAVLAATAMVGSIQGPKPPRAFDTHAG